MENQKYYIIVEIPKYDKKYVSELYDANMIINFKYDLKNINSRKFVELNIEETYRPLESSVSKLCITEELLNKCIITINKLKPVD